jgi:hypothetical protein
VASVATGEAEDIQPDDGTDPTAKALGAERRQSGKAMTPEHRAEIAGRAER